MGKEGRLSRIGKGYVIHIDDGLAQPDRCIEDFHIIYRLAVFHGAQGFIAVASCLLLGRTGLGAAADPGRFPADQIAPFGRFRFFPFQPGLTLFEIRCVISTIRIDLSPVQFQHVPGDAVEEIPVVSAQNQGRLAVVEILFQPAYGTVVEVVRRFIHDEQITRQDQRPCQPQPFPLAAGQGIDGLGQIGNPQLLEHHFGMLLQFPGLLFIHFPGQLQHGFIVVCFDSGFIAAQDIHDRQITIEDTFENTASRIKLRFLGKIMDTGLGIAPDFPLISLGHAGDDFEQRRLACPVQTDEAQLLPTIDSKGHIIKQHTRAIRFSHAFYS